MLSVRLFIVSAWSFWFHNWLCLFHFESWLEIAWLSPLWLQHLPDIFDWVWNRFLIFWSLSLIWIMDRCRFSFHLYLLLVLLDAQTHLIRGRCCLYWLLLLWEWFSWFSFALCWWFLMFGNWDRTFLKKFVNCVINLTWRLPRPYSLAWFAGKRFLSSWFTQWLAIFRWLFLRNFDLLSWQGVNRLITLRENWLFWFGLALGNFNRLLERMLLRFRMRWAWLNMVLWWYCPWSLYWELLSD